MSNYQLTREQLLEYPGLNGMLAACHLRVYEARGSKPVCIVGNFDGGVGTTTTNAIEMVATTIREQTGLRSFTLIEWYPHGYPSWPFSEVRLRGSRLGHREAARIVVIGEGDEVVADSVRRVRVRFTNPEWDSCSAERLAGLLGGDAVRELTELAGEYDGDYDAARALGEPAQERVSELHHHNIQRLSGIAAQLAEWETR